MVPIVQSVKVGMWRISLAKDCDRSMAACDCDAHIQSSDSVPQIHTGRGCPMIRAPITKVEAINRFFLGGVKKGLPGDAEGVVPTTGC